MATLKPDSGIQLIIILGAMFVPIRPDLGMTLLTLGIGTWALYNIVNLSRQF
jgi:hypothetical protein